VAANQAVLLRLTQLDTGDVDSLGGGIVSNPRIDGKAAEQQSLLVNSHVTPLVGWQFTLGYRGSLLVELVERLGRRPFLM